MYEFKHTPGPWHVQDDHGKRWIEAAGNDDTIAEVHRRRSKGSVYSCEEALANAKLIHAAPDLLKAATEVCEAWGKFIDSSDYVPGIGDMAENIEFQEMMRLRSAINKAIE